MSHMYYYAPDVHAAEHPGYAGYRLVEAPGYERVSSYAGYRRGHTSPLPQGPAPAYGHQQPIFIRATPPVSENKRDPLIYFILGVILTFILMQSRRR